MNARTILMALSYVVQERGENDPIVSIETWMPDENEDIMKITVVNEMETEISMLVAVNRTTLALAHFGYLN